jgi:hypothetical protein
VRHDSGPETAGSGGGSTDERRGVVVDMTGRVGEVDRRGHWQIPRGAQAASCRQPAGYSEGEKGCRFDIGYPEADPGPEAA